MHPKLFIFSPF